MRACHLDAVVEVHLKAFEGFFLTRMGSEFLRAYYESVLNFEGAIALVAAEDDGDIAGFAVGFDSPQKFYAEFRRRRIQLLPKILISMIRDPSLIAAILGNVRRVDARAMSTVDAVELSSIAVGKTGLGIGALLLNAFLRAASKRGAARVVLTTDAKDNDYVRGFYEGHGFVVTGYEERSKRCLCCFEKKLAPESH